MADKTHIEWTDATWNPITGCSVVSPGCTNCYAMRLAGTRLRHLPSRKGLTTDSKAGPVWNGEVRFNEKWIDQPLKWRKPRMIFVCAHGDLFHESVPDEWIDRVFAVMALCPQHIFQVLTKRSARMRKYFERESQDEINSHAGGLMRWDEMPMREWPMNNCWLGFSAEDQQRFDERWAEFRTLAEAGWLTWCSAEPLLGPIDASAALPMRADQVSVHHHPDNNRDDPKVRELTRMLVDSVRKRESLRWVVAGGESGPGARPMHLDWARDLRDQCNATGVPFLFKQWGEWLPVGQHLPGCGKIHGGTAVVPGRMKLHYGGTSTQEPAHAFAEHGVEFVSFASTADGRLAFRVGKKAAGRLLDGVTHDDFPEVTR